MAMDRKIVRDLKIFSASLFDLVVFAEATLSVRDIL